MDKPVDKPHEQIAALLADDLGAVNDLIRARMASRHAPRIPEVTAHLVEAGGKRIRPMLTLAAADRLDKGLPANREIASAKVYASEMLARVTDATLQIFGGMGLMDDFPIERFWRDARVERIWDGTSEIQRHIISRELLRPLGA